MGKTYQVETSGHAPKGVVAGDYVQTQGGTYQILDSTKYKGMTNDQLAQAGVGFNPTTGLYSKKVSGTNSGTSQPRYTQFDNESWKDNYIKGQLAGLDKNYAIGNANLTRTFNINKAEFGDHIIDVKKSYDQSVSQLEQDAYRNNIMAKQQASSQGLTSSGQGIALAQSALNNANKNAVGLWKSKEESINKIQNAINQLSANYNIDKDTLLSAYHADKLGIMSGAEVNALEQKLKVDMANAGLKNQWDMMEYQIKNDNEWKAKELELAYKQLAASSSRYSGGGSGESEDKPNAEYETQLVKNFENYLNAQAGGDFFGKLTPIQKKQYNDSFYQVEYGMITADQHIENMNRLVTSVLLSGQSDGLGSKSTSKNIGSSIKNIGSSIKNIGSSTIDELLQYELSQEAFDRRQNHYKGARYRRR